jgi:hypothetical protein
MYRKTFGAVLTALVVGYAGSSAGYSALVPLANPFTIARVYSDASGDAQFVVLEPMAGAGDPEGQTTPRLMVTNRYGVTRQLALTGPAMRTAGARVVVVTQSLAATLPPGFADAVMPDQFLPTDGGTIAFGGSDRWSYEALPVDGSSLFRDGSVGDALLRNAHGIYGYAGSGSHVIYEFYNAALDHYFMSGSQPDIDALDSGRIPGWARTGQTLLAPTEPVMRTPDVHIDPIELGIPARLAGGPALNPDPRMIGPPLGVPSGPDVHIDPIERGGPSEPLSPLRRKLAAVESGAPAASTVDGTVPVCRYELPSGSHFFSASANECNVVATTVDGAVLETSSAFLTWLPLAASGACPVLPEGAASVELVPVYRLWNGRADSNHRYTTDRTTRNAMLKAGWQAEGYGDDGVAMCAPSSPL